MVRKYLKKGFALITIIFMITGLIGSRNIFAEDNITNNSSAEDNIANDISDLSTKVENADDGEIIKLSSSFQGGDVELKIPKAIEVTIDGGNQEYGAGRIKIVNSNKGTGTDFGKITIKNLKFTQDTKSAVEIRTNAKVVLDNIKIENRNSSIDGGALYICGRGDGFSNSDIEILNSTFKGNSCNGKGYGGGAIYAPKYDGNIKISNCYFEKNKTTNRGTSFGGEGGAISFNQSGNPAVTNFNISIENSYFVENEASNSYNQLSDGGAVSLF
ncbi:MAG: hypothetical protein LBR30_08160, partial [Clostridioides sp.]|nr:hypothetical protein [Clostridioides sp.]